jgi:copper transport protein
MRRSWATRGLLGALGAVVALAFALGLPGDAGAHAVLERSAPVQSQQLAAPPELVETFFSEPLERSLTKLEVLDVQGNPVHQGETIFSNDDPRYAAIAVEPELPPGIYTATYQNVSRVDGHTWSGFFSFVVLNPDGTVPAGEAPVPSGLAGQVGSLPDNTDSALRWVGLLAAALLGGALFFAVLAGVPAGQFLDAEPRGRVERSALVAASAVVVPAAAAVALSTVAQLFLLADRLGGLGELGILVSTRTGELWLARTGLALALLVLSLPVLRSEAYRSGRHAPVAALLGSVGALGLLMTYSLASHAATGGGEFWAVGSDFVHFAATAAWLGALLQLPLLFWWAGRRLEGAERVLYRANALDRFSWLAVVSVVLLIGTGVFNGFVQLPTLESLWDTTYGRVLMAKLALILLLLPVAGLNAFLVKPALVRAIDALHDEQAERPRAQDRRRFEERLARLQWLLPRTTIAELVLGVAVLASVSVLAQSTTAQGELRQEATRPSGSFVATLPAGELQAELTIDPLGITVSTFTVKLTPPAGTPLGEVLGVRLSAAFDDPNLPPSAGRTSTTVDLEPTDDPAAWSTESALLTQPGDWRLQARIRRRGMDDVDSEFFSVPAVGGFLARRDEPHGLFDLPFTSVGPNVAGGGAMIALGLGAFLIWRNRPRWWEREVSTAIGLSSVFALIAGAILVFGVDVHQTRFQSESPIPPTTESILMGQALFERNCVSCHGQTGEGDGPGAAALALPPPRLGDHVPFHNDGTLFLWISEGIPVDEAQKYMPSFKDQLSEEERWHLVNFLRKTFGSGRFVPVLPDDATPQGG